MAKRTKTPPEILKAKQPVVLHLARELKVSRFQVYGLIDPLNYRDAIPADLFDTRSDLAERVADFAGIPVGELRDFYAEVKAA